MSVNIKAKEGMKIKKYRYPISVCALLTSSAYTATTMERTSAEVIARNRDIPRSVKPKGVIVNPIFSAEIEVSIVLREEKEPK